MGARARGQELRGRRRCRPGSWRSRLEQVGRPNEGLQPVLQFLPADRSVGEEFQRLGQADRHPGWLDGRMVRLAPIERPIVPAPGAAVALYRSATTVQPPGQRWMEVASRLALRAPLACSTTLWHSGTLAVEASSRHLQAGVSLELAECRMSAGKPRAGRRPRWQGT